MMAILAFLKAKLSGTVAIILAVLAGLVWHRQVVASRDKWKAQAKQAQAGIKRQAETEEREAEIEQEWSDYAKQAEKDTATVPDILADPDRYH